MKALIIYVSIFEGNTRQIAKTIAGVLDAPFLEPEEVHIASL